MADDLSAPAYKPRLLKGYPVEEDVLTLARARIRHVYSLFDQVAVSFSGGKDSTIVLNLALEVARELNRLPLRVIFWDEEAIFSENVDYVRRVAAEPDIALDWYCIPVKHRNACSSESPTWYPWAPEDRELWVRELPPEAITTLKGYDPQVPEDRLSIPELSGLLSDPELGNCCMLLGIRADESMTRRRAVIAREQENYIVKHNTGYGGATNVQGAGNIWKAYPIYDWRTPDVWLAPKLLGWDYCRVYDLMDKYGIKPNRQRLAPPFGEEPMQGLAQFHEIEPALWDRMVYRVPGAATAKRYSRTSLYAFGELPERPAGLSFEDVIHETITQRFPADIAPQVAKAIQKHIQTHFRKTSDLLAPRHAHPKTGYSYKFLLQIATRGDFKGRRQPPLGVLDDLALQRKQEKYQADLAQYQADLTRERAQLAAELATEMPR